MKQKFSPLRPSPAMTVAVVALFSSLAGGATAAKLVTGKDIAKKAVAGKHVKPNTISGKHVKDRSLFARDFKAGQLPAGRDGAVGAKGATGAKGDRGTTGPQGLQGGRGPAGTPGLKGDKGDDGAPGADGAPGSDGAPGVSGLERASTTSALSSNSPKTITASCPAGKKVLGFGSAFTGGIGGAGNAEVTNVALHRLAPNEALTSVTATAYETVAVDTEWSLTLHVLCATVSD